MGIMNSIIFSSIFYQVGGKRLYEPPTNPDEVAHNKQVTVNYIGLVFFAGLDQFVSISLSQVMQIPNLRPVFVRE